MEFVAVGDDTGTVSLLEVCDSLGVMQSNEKSAMHSMFEREMRREKNLEARAKELKRAEARLQAKQDEDQEAKDKLDETAMEEVLQKIEADFLQLINVGSTEN